MQPDLHPFAPAGMDHQPIRGDEQHLEKHKEVEHVPRQERTTDAHKLKLEQRMEMPPAIVPSGGDGMDQHNECQNAGQKHHQGRQPVQHQHNAKRRGPIAQLVNECLTG